MYSGYLYLHMQVHRLFRLLGPVFCSSVPQVSHALTVLTLIRYTVLSIDEGMLAHLSLKDRLMMLQKQLKKVYATVCYISSIVTHDPKTRYYS